MWLGLQACTTTQLPIGKVALGKWRQEDFEFKASLDYILRPFLKKKKKICGLGTWLKW
jgi:hypothetical protein